MSSTLQIACSKVVDDAIDRMHELVAENRATDAVAVYDVIMGTQLMAEKSGREEHWQIVRDGLDWFRKHEPRAYMVLLD